jgi:ATPase subunit of ABC transporter with duplicated ATPase domains
MGAKVVAGWAEARAGRTVAVRRTELERAERALAERPVARETGGNVWLRWEPAPRARLLALDGARVDAGGAPLLGDVRVSLGRADRVWVRGANGAGKSTLLAALLRAASLPEGRLVTLAQETGPDDDARDLAAVRRLAPDVRGRVLAHAAALGVDPDALLATGRPSPGEARQLRIALGLGTHAWGLVLDEPTNHLDLPAIERLERALADYPGALLLATHDEALARRCARVAWTVAGGRVEVGAL